MKKLIFILIIAFAALTIYGQDEPPPTAELTHYTIKESYPAFIVITNSPVLFPEATDYYFTYNVENYCMGGYFAYIDYARAFADDPNTNIIEGFTNGETIFLGFYDSSADKYYNLITDIDLTYKSLGLYKVVALPGHEIELNVNPALTASEIKYTDLPAEQDIYKDENVFFNIITKNIVDLNTEILKGGGTLKVVDRWVNNGFVNRQYTSVNDDNVAVFKTTGIGMYSGEPIVVLDSVVLNKSDPEIKPPPETEERILYSDASITVEVRPSKWGEEIWVINKTDNPLVYYFSFEKKSGSITSNSNSRRPLAADSDVRALITQDKYAKLYVNRIKVGANVIQINKVFEL